MIYMDGMVDVVCSVSAGVALTKGMQWVGKKIGLAAGSPVIDKVARLFIGVATPYVVNGTAEYLGLDSNIRLLISAGVQAELILSGATLGTDVTGSQNNRELGVFAGRIAAISGTFLLNVNKGSQIGFLVSSSTIEYLFIRQETNPQGI